MSAPAPYQIKTIAEYHRIMGLAKPEHPLISVIKFEQTKNLSADGPRSISHEFYAIALKRNFHTKMKYGQQEVDFDEGMLFFMSPKQVLSIPSSTVGQSKHSGWLLLIHPDFLYNTSLSKKIRQYEYFSYKVNEALHLSDKEEAMLTSIMQNIAKEYHSAIDRFSQEVIIAQLELLLIYSDRFYDRQFITRKIVNDKILIQLEEVLSGYFSRNDLALKGLPTVQFIADSLNISPNYLSRLLKLLTGQSTKQFIHDKLIDLAKEKLSTTDLSISEIAYQIGFGHSQSFSKLFKSKTKISPVEFRESFN